MATGKLHKKFPKVLKAVWFWVGNDVENDLEIAMLLKNATPKTEIFWGLEIRMQRFFRFLSWG